MCARTCVRINKTLYGQPTPCYRSSSMSCWLSKDVVSMPLKRIEEEISSVRSISMAERAIDHQRIKEGRGCGGW